jgi:hypothetical protein
LENVAIQLAYPDTVLVSTALVTSSRGEFVKPIEPIEPIKQEPNQAYEKRSEPNSREPYKKPLDPLHD